MRAAYIKQTGPAETIIVGELPTPEPRAAKCSSGRRRRPSIPSTPTSAAARWRSLPMPFVVGCDLAGIVEELGPEANVSNRATASGVPARAARPARTFAEYAAVDENFSTPSAVYDETAAACALVVAHRPPGPTASQAATGRDAFRQRRHRRRWLDGRADAKAIGAG